MSGLMMFAAAGGCGAWTALWVWIGWRRGHYAGWYHGYAARLYESVDGEHYR